MKKDPSCHFVAPFDVASMRMRRETESILNEIGASQCGIVTRAQLLQRGVPAHTIDRYVHVGRLTVLYRGIYQAGPLPVPGARERLALLACRGKGRISHFSAAAMGGLLDARRAAERVDVTVPHWLRRRIDGVRLHRVQHLRDDEVTIQHGMPMTTPARTLLDLGAVCPAREVEQALATALRNRLATHEELCAMVARHRTHRGAPMLRRLLDQENGPAFTRSEAEEKLLEIVRAAGLPQPRLNVLLLGYEIDFLWGEERLIAEVDGYEAHGSARAFEADRRRDAGLTAAGYRVIRFTWSDCTERRLATAARLAQALVR